MTDSKIYNVLTHFDKVEQNRLRKYIRSPYFNANETLMIFYDILAERINENGKATVLTKENIWIKRPGTGKILAEHFNDLLGKVATRDIVNDEQLDFIDFK